MYGEGHSEGLLGQLVRANPDKRLYTASKVPPKNRKWPSLRESTLEDTFPPDYVEEYVHLSLKNLGLERVDLMQFHVWEDAWLEDDAVQTLTSCALRGSRRGASASTAVTIERRAPVRTGLVDAVKVIYNIFDRTGDDRFTRLPSRRCRHRARPLDEAR